MAALKCPNPSCPFLFDPTQVPPGAMLTCPRCMMKFTLGDSTPATPSTQTAEPEQEQETATSSFLQSKAMIVVGIAAIMTIAGALIAVFVIDKPTRALVQSSDKQFREVNFAIKVPDGWEVDDDARMTAKVNVIALKKSDSSARIAIATSNFRDRNPQPGELMEGIVSERLKAMFTDLETTTTEGNWLGRDATKVTFRGRGMKPEGNFAGEAYALGVHGHGYWLIAWSLEADFATVSGDLATLEKNCRLIDPKKEWKPSTSGVTTIAAENSEYRLLDGDQWWVKQADPKDEDPKADMFLKARFKSNVRTDFPPEACAVVYLFPGSTNDPMGTLRSYVKTRYAKKEGFDIKIWKDVSDDPQGDPPGAGVTGNQDVPRYHAESENKAGSKLVVLSAIATHSGVVGIEAYCPWSDRSKWEKRLMALAASLQKQ